MDFFQFIAMIRSSRTDLESKIPQLCILDNNPQKPVVRMANLCVVSAHTVRESPFVSLETEIVHTLLSFPQNPILNVLKKAKYLT